MALNYFIDEETRYPSQLTLSLIFIALAGIVISLIYFDNLQPSMDTAVTENSDNVVPDTKTLKYSDLQPQNPGSSGHENSSTNTTSHLQPVQAANTLSPKTALNHSQNNVATNTTAATSLSQVASTWHVITITSHTTLKDIFTQLGIDQAQSFDILKQRVADHFLTHLTPGHEVHVEMSSDHKLLQLQYPIDIYRLLVVKPTIASQSISSTILPLELQKQEKELKGVANNSLMSALVENHVPKRIQDEMKTILSWQDHSFQQHEHYKLIFNDYYFGQQEVRSGHLLAAQIEKNGKTLTAIRYVDRQGHANYYAANGSPLHAAFIRFPMHFSHISSAFSAVGRWHPILHLFRPHLGVDLAAPTGTPVHAVADGIIRSHGYSGGYGNAVMIDHGHGYSTLYGHLWHFANGEHIGSHVHLGDVIGYVGETGLATGPHLHYEVRINGIHYDPTKVKLPSGGVLPTRERHEFAVLASKVMTELNSNTPLQSPVTASLQNKLANSVG